MTYTDRNIMRQTTAFIAEALMKQTDDTYTVDFSPAVLDHRSAYIDGPDGIRLMVAPTDRQHRNSTTRLLISGNYPAGAIDAMRHIDHHGISVARDRGPEGIARDIVRRVLPGYIETLAKVKQAITRHADDKRRQAETTARLALLVRGTGQGDKIWLSGFAGDSYGDLHVNGDGTKVELDIRSLPVEVAEAMLKAALDA